MIIMGLGIVFLIFLFVAIMGRMVKSDREFISSLTAADHSAPHHRAISSVVHRDDE
jgi:hypothetical protein